MSKSKSLTKFNNNTNRVITQLECFEEIKKHVHSNEFEQVYIGLKTSLNKIDYSEVVRSAIVLAVASMDTYYSDIFLEILVPYIKKNGCSESLERELEESGFTIKESLDLLRKKSGSRPFKKVKNRFADRLEYRTFQKFSVIDEIMKCFGIINFSVHVERKCGQKLIRRKIEKLVQRRHEIVHQADLNKYGKLRPIAISDYLKNLVCMEKFVTASDEILINLIK